MLPYPSGAPSTGRARTSPQVVLHVGDLHLTSLISRFPGGSGGSHASRWLHVAHVLAQLSGPAAYAFTFTLS